MVYSWCMARTNIDVDDEVCKVVVSRYHLSTKREAFNFVLGLVAVEPFETDGARALRGSGWDGDLEEIRSARV